MILKSYFARDIKNKEALANQCVEIANSANFNTDFNDVYEHLFFGDNLMLVFAFDENKKMVGFSSIFLSKEANGTPHIHLNGIIVKPEYQNRGLAKLMLSRAVGYVYGLNNKSAESGFKVSLSARTQNPAVYRLMQKSSKKLSPNVNGVVCKKHYAIVKKMDKDLKPFLGDYDKEFIVKNAYPSSKVQANVKNEEVKVLFSKLDKFDAFIMYGNNVKNLDREQVQLGIADYLQVKNATNQQELNKQQKLEK